MKVVSDINQKLLDSETVGMLSRIGDVRLSLLYDEQFLEEAKDADAIFLESKKIDDAVLEAAPKLKIVARNGVGYDNVDVEACTRHEVYVTNTPGVLSDAVADLTLGFMLCLSRNLIELDRYAREQWASKGDFPKLGFDLKNKVCGVIGLGRIGFQVAKRVYAFGMRIIYCDISRNEKAEELFDAERVGLDELLRESDYVTVHVFLDKKTRGMIGRRELGLMKKTAFIINTSRGGVIDQAALTQFLREHRIAGAGLDVFEREPIPSDDSILKLDNLILAPHAGTSTNETRHAMALTAVRNISAALRGDVPPDFVPEQKGKVFHKI